MHANQRNQHQKTSRSRNFRDKDQHWKRISHRAHEGNRKAKRGPPVSLEPGSGFPFYSNNAILRLTDLHLLLGAPQGFERSPISESALPGASVLYAIHVTHIFHLFVIPRSDNALSVLAGNLKTTKQLILRKLGRCNAYT